MSLCPFATIRLLPESGTQPSMVPRAAILHSAAGKGSLFGWFHDNSNLESTFWVGEDGTIEQYMDTLVRADANLNANGFAISIETESSRLADEPWNPVQAAAIVRLVDWLCTEHGIPRQQIPTSRGSGIGWHVMWGSPGDWTPVAKSCPGPARIVQTRDEIIPAVIAAAHHPEEFTVDPAAETRFDALESKVDRLLASDRTNTARVLEAVRGVRRLLEHFKLAR